MKMGIKEFRERISDLARSNQVVIITNHGKRVGRFIPEGRRKAAEDVDLEAWAAGLERGRDSWRKRTPDWRKRLIASGLAADEIAG